MVTKTRARVNQNGRIVIPAAFRKALGMDEGEEVLLTIEDGGLRITTLKRRIQHAQQFVRKHLKPGESLADELIADRRKAGRNE
jgi:AbrB family looped-hinge helix DNA binding protein